MCTETIQMPVELEGKQGPCPECRRIVKVPLREKKDPKDWRKVRTGVPSGAKVDEPAPEGTWDAAAKTAALANVLMGSSVTPHDVRRTGIADVRGEDVAAARASGRRIRLVARAARHDGSLVAAVEPELLEPDDPLAGLVDTANALYLSTDLLGEVGVVQRSGDLTQTAYALLSDVSRISLRLRDWTER